MSEGRRRRYQVLVSICHAFGSARSVEEVVSSVDRWTRGAVAVPGVEVRIALPDRLGRLRAVSRNHAVAEKGRLRTAKRRAAFGSKQRASYEIQEPPGWSLTILPFVCRGEALGVLEVTCPRDVAEESGEVLDAITSQAAIALWNLRTEEHLRREVETLGKAVRLGRELVKASSPKQAIHTAALFHFERFQVPVAGWLRSARSEPYRLIVGYGLGARKRKKLREDFATLRRWGAFTPEEESSLSARLAEAFGVEDVELLVAGDAIIAAGSPGPSHNGHLNIVGSLLEGVLNHLSAVARANRRNEHLDLGLAWTAHELRGPLLGVKAALELLLEADDGASLDRAMLSRSQREIEQLAGATSDVLRWAIHGGELSREPANIVRIVEEAVESCQLGMEGDRVVIHAPERLVGSVDPTHLRGAIANLVRNALAYSPPDSKVQVDVEATRPGWAIIAVRDEGPGISDGDTWAIFEPFVRGHGADPSRGGRGLGLFIARRVVEAHGGNIWAESSDKGAVFYIRLPLAKKRIRGSAS